jgi:hypothetical protein
MIVRLVVGVYGKRDAYRAGQVYIGMPSRLHSLVAVQQNSICPF